jgi:hypothetical protein
LRHGGASPRHKPRPRQARSPGAAAASEGSPLLLRGQALASQADPWNILGCGAARTCSGGGFMGVDASRPIQRSMVGQFVGPWKTAGAWAGGERQKSGGGREAARAGAVAGAGFGPDCAPPPPPTPCRRAGACTVGRRSRLTGAVGRPGWEAARGAGAADGATGREPASKAEAMRRRPSARCSAPHGGPTAPATGGKQMTALASKRGAGTRLPATSAGA